jgi:hypothetical protein
VESDWLTEAGFLEFDLLPLNRQDVDRFIDRWHDAVLTTVGENEERAEVERCRAALRDTLRRKNDLYQLSTNPLMCALICALHRDRYTRLPERRMELYGAALTMLLVRRDKEREVPVPEGLEPTEEAQIQLLQRIAYWLIRNGRSEAAQSSAIRIIQEKLPAMPQMAAPKDADRVFQYLLLRSGLLREPSFGAVDFVHRTFQDYLGAKAAVEAEDLDLLVDRARNDQWEDVVRMAVGHARDSERAYLLRRLVQTGDQRPELRRRYHLLAAAALEHATTLDPAVRAEVALRASALIPPATAADAEALATAGAIVLDLLPDAHELTLEQATATIITIARIGGDAALHKLVAFTRIPHREVRQQLANTWPYFDANSFANRILAGLPMNDLTVHFTTAEQLACLPELGLIPGVSVPGNLLSKAAVDAMEAAGITSLTLGPPSVTIAAVPVLARFTSLRRLTITSAERLTDIAAFGDTGIYQLSLGAVPAHLDVSGLANAQELRELELTSDDVIQLPTGSLPHITVLRLRSALAATEVPDILAAFPGLRKLELELVCLAPGTAVDLSPLRSLAHGRITFVGAGKVHGQELLTGDVTVEHVTRPSRRFLRRFRA